jgi:glycosyltransferase involved in cell wall biosynthesis
VRIAIDAREIAGKPTGVGRYLSEILSAWAHVPGTFAHEFILCTTEAHSAARWAPLRISSVSAAGSGTVWEQLVLPRLIKTAGADVLFAPAYTAPLRCPVPVVLTVHDVSFAAHPEWFSWREGLRRRLITRASARRAARVLTQSDFTKREAVRYLGLDQSRVDVIYLGATTLAPSHLRTLAPSHPRTLAPSHLRDPLVLFVGSLFNRRHVPELIEGFARLASRHPTVRLEIVGDNRTMPVIDVDDVIARSGVADRIRARQYVSDAELSALYAQASVFAFLSEYEGFGLTPLEAMAAGVPVVVLDTEVGREIYGPAAGYVPRPEPDLIAGALERLLVDDEERARLVEAGAKQVGRYSWDECARRTLQVLLACAR